MDTHRYARAHTRSWNSMQLVVLIFAGKNLVMPFIDAVAGEALNAPTVCFQLAKPVMLARCFQSFPGPLSVRDQKRVEILAGTGKCKAAEVFAEAISKNSMMAFPHRHSLLELPIPDIFSAQLFVLTIIP